MLLRQATIQTGILARRRGVRAISQKRLNEFWTAHADAEDHLRAWYKTVKKARWQSFADVRRVYSNADRVGECYVFNIRGNAYRLIVRFLYDWTLALICVVLTHPEYDKEQWKDTCRCNT
jgi:mRNA interferase HigB